MRILHLSDIHQFHESLPNLYQFGCDVICITGDVTNFWSPELNHHEWYSFLEWIANYSKDIPVIFIGGNHESYLSKYREDAIKQLEARNIIYLENSSVTLQGVTFWGSPITPTFGNWYFMCDSSIIQYYWNMIPENTDILLTHGPPYGVLDIVNTSEGLQSKGCKFLQQTISKLPNLKAHLFGHIHSNPVIINHGIKRIGNVTYSNGSLVTDSKNYTLQLKFKPIIINL